MSEYTQASLLVFRPSVDLLDELKKNRALYFPEPNDPWVTIYNVSDAIRLNLHRVKSKIEQTGKRLGDHPCMNAAISLGASWLHEEKDISPLLEARQQFNCSDSDMDHLTARVVQSVFESFPITFDTGKRLTLHMPIVIHRKVSSLAEDAGTTVNNICLLSMMRSLSILPETIYESGQEMMAKVDEFRKLCRIRHRAINAILQEFEL